MKKIFTIIFAVFSVIILGGYIVSMEIMKEKPEYKIEDISGDRNILGDNKIITEISPGILEHYELIISKDKEELKKKNIDAANLNISEEEFKDKEVFRGIKNLELPLYEDDQYKIIINSTSQYDKKSAEVLNHIKISCRNKKTDELKKFDVTTPTRYAYIKPIKILNEEGDIKYIIQGPSRDNKGEILEIYSIDVKNESINSEKKLFLDKIGNNFNEYIRYTTYNNGKVYFTISSSEDNKQDEIKIISVDINDLSTKEHKNEKDKLKEDENIDLISKSSGSVNEILYNIYSNENKIVLYNLNNGKMDIKEFNMDTEKFKEYSVELDDKCVVEEKNNYYTKIVKMESNYIYIEINKRDGLNMTSKTYLNVLDSKENKSLYLGKIDIPTHYKSIQIKN